jgi:hypothetical protein
MPEMSWIAPDTDRRQPNVLAARRKRKAFADNMIEPDQVSLNRISAAFEPNRPPRNPAVSLINPAGDRIRETRKGRSDPELPMLVGQSCRFRARKLKFVAFARLSTGGAI